MNNCSEYNVERLLGVYKNYKLWFEVLDMIATEKVIFTPEEMVRMEIRNFVNEGLKDVQDGNLYDFDDVFDEIESR